MGCRLDKHQECTVSQSLMKHMDLPRLSQKQHAFMQILCQAEQCIEMHFCGYNELNFANGLTQLRWTVKAEFTMVAGDVTSCRAELGNEAVNIPKLA